MKTTLTFTIYVGVLLIVFALYYAHVPFIIGYRYFGGCNSTNYGRDLIVYFEGNELRFPRNLVNECFSPLFLQSWMADSRYISLSGPLTEFRRVTKAGDRTGELDELTIRLLIHGLVPGLNYPKEVPDYNSDYLLDYLRDEMERKTVDGHPLFTKSDKTYFDFVIFERIIPTVFSKTALLAHYDENGQPDFLINCDGELDSGRASCRPISRYITKGVNYSYSYSSEYLGHWKEIDMIISEFIEKTNQGEVFRWKFGDFVN